MAGMHCSRVIKVQNVWLKHNRSKTKHVEPRLKTRFITVEVSSKSMKAVVVTVLGGPEVLQVQQVEDPELKDGEVLIKVEAAALNRLDGSTRFRGKECSRHLRVLVRTRVSNVLESSRPSANTCHAGKSAIR
jgi:hypothetical protein